MKRTIKQILEIKHIIKQLRRLKSVRRAFKDESQLANCFQIHRHQRKSSLEGTIVEVKMREAATALTMD